MHCVLPRRRIVRGSLLLLVVSTLAFFVSNTSALMLANFQAASMVLGQSNFTSNSAAATRSGMDRPQAVVVDTTTGKLFVVEYGNNRVLRFASAASLANGAGAEAVLGQSDFTSSSSATTQSGMQSPVGVAIDSAGRLWVADKSNNRVLRFDNASSKANGANADGVLGQSDFTGSGLAATQSGMWNPTGVAVDNAGRLWVADQGNNRVLRFDNASSKANGANADGVLGQTDFTSPLPDTKQNRLFHPYAVAVDSAGRLWVADTENNRVLRFDNAVAKANGANADGVLGQPDFTSYLPTTTQDRIGFPVGLATDANGRLYVSEVLGNRVVWFDSAAAKANGANADGVLGQPDFSASTANNGGLSAATLKTPYGPFYDQAGGVLWLADTYNNRVLMYGTLNTAPTISDIADLTTGEDTATGAIGFTVGDGQTAAGSLTVSGSSSNTALVPNANIVFGGSGASRTVTIAPAANQNGNATITVTVSDGSLTATDTFVLTVNAVNDAPTVSDGNLAATEDTPATGTLSASDLEGNRLTYSIVANGSKGSVTITDTATGAFTYTPNANANGLDSFTFKANDGAADSNVATVTVSISAVNDAPVATNGNLAATEDITATGTLNASDVEGDSLTYSIVANGSKGSVTITDAATGAYTYTLNANANGSDSFTFKANDGTADSNTATVSITIAEVNDAPTGADDSLSDVAEDSGARTIPFATLLGNDSFGPANEGGQTLTITGVGSAVGGSVVISGSDVIFTPTADYSGPGAFSYTLEDDGITNGAADPKTATGNATFLISSVDDAPTLNAMADVSLNESASLQTINLSGISAGPADESSQTLTVTASSSNPALIANPAVTYNSPNATGTLSFTPAPGLSGSAMISVVVTDNGGNVAPNANSFTRTFAVFVGSVNNRPTLDQPADMSIMEDAGVQTVSLTGIDIGSSAEVGQSLTVTASSDSALIPNPTVSYTSSNATGTLSFTPLANANGTATIRVTVRDDGGTLNGGIDFVERAFRVSITPVNDQPDFTAGANQVVSALSGPQAVAGWASGFTPGPADEAGQTILGYRVVSNSNPALFIVPPAVAANGTLTYTPAQGAGGTATIGITVGESGGTANGGVATSAVKTFTITIRPGYRNYLPMVTTR